MTQKARIYLGDYFFIVPARANLKKPLFGEQYMHLGPFIFGGLHVFTMSAVLGYARPNKLDSLMQLLPPIHFRPDTGAASSQAAHFEWMLLQDLKKMGREPTTFLDYWVHTHTTGFTQETMANPRIARGLAKEKVKLTRIIEQINGLAGEGLTFGATQARLFERLYHEQFEAKVEQGQWDLARAIGLDIPAQQDVIPLAEMVRDILAEMSEFVSQCFPELIDDLDLREPRVYRSPETSLNPAPPGMGNMVRPFYERMLFLLEPKMLLKVYPELPFLTDICMAVFDELQKCDASSITVTRDKMAAAYEETFQEELQAAGIELFGTAWGQRFKRQDDLLREAAATMAYLQDTDHLDLWDSGIHYNQALVDAVFADAGNEVDAVAYDQAVAREALASLGIPADLALRISQRIGVDRELTEEAKVRLAEVFLERNEFPLDSAPPELQLAIKNVVRNMMSKLYLTCQSAAAEASAANQNTLPEPS